DQHLLLIAAAQLHDHIVQSAHLDVQCLAQLPAIGTARALVYEAVMRKARQRGDLDVLEYGERREQPRTLAILREKSDAMLDGSLGRVDDYLATVDVNLTGGGGRETEQRLRKIGPSGADQT